MADDASTIPPTSVPTLSVAILPVGHPPLQLPTCLHSIYHAWTSSQGAALCQEPLALCELQAALTRGKRRIAPGADGVVPQMLRNLAASEQQRLLECFSEIWQSGQVPEAWRRAIVAPMLKPRKPARELLSNLPVSLTSAACKVMEAMALARLHWVARARGFLADQQTGSRRRWCTADSIADMVSTLEDAKAGGDLVKLLLIDVQGAFDSLAHAVFQQGLHLLGICGNLREFLSSFLRNRTLRHRPYHLGQEDRGPATASQRISPPLSCPAELGGRPISWSKAVTYLALRTDHRLTWLPATKALCTQALGVRKAISQLLARGQGCTTRWALQLFQAAAISLLLYALPLVALPLPRLRKLELQHRSAVRLCLGVPQTSLWLRQVPGPCDYCSFKRGYGTLIAYIMPQMVKHS
nr:uncharacterized protein LOC126526719 [Dermacentor andersoni]